MNYNCSSLADRNYYIKSKKIGGDQSLKTEDFWSMFNLNQLKYYTFVCTDYQYESIIKTIKNKQWKVSQTPHPQPHTDLTIQLLNISLTPRN